MTFGPASLGTPVEQLSRPIATAAAGEPRKRRGGGRPPYKYDCGPELGELTTRQIAKVAGVTRNTVQTRINRGVRGAALAHGLKVTRSAANRKRGVSKPVIFTACRLALAFPDTIPTVPQIRAIHPMSVPAAERWRAAMRDARLALEVRR